MVYFDMQKTFFVQTKSSVFLGVKNLQFLFNRKDSFTLPSKENSIGANRTHTIALNTFLHKGYFFRQGFFQMIFIFLEHSG